jgi:TonB family protein
LEIKIQKARPTKINLSSKLSRKRSSAAAAAGGVRIFKRKARTHHICCVVNLNSVQILPAKHIYPQEAKNKGIGGSVKVDVVIDEGGNVIWAKFISGPEVFKNSVLTAACNSRFNPINRLGKVVKASFVIKYNFTNK